MPRAKRKTDLERAIRELDEEINVLQMARERLVRMGPPAVQVPRPVATKRGDKPPTEKVG